MTGEPKTRQRAYAVKWPRGEAFMLNSIRSQREDTQKYAETWDWENMQAEGFKIVPIEIIEVGE